MPTGSEEERARAFIAAVRDLAASIGIPPTLDALQADDIDELAELAVAEAFGDYPVPRFMNTTRCAELIAKLLPAA